VRTKPSITHAATNRGLAGGKYARSQPEPQHQHQFSFDRMLALTGTNAPYCSCVVRIARQSPPQREANMANSRNGNCISSDPRNGAWCGKLLKASMAWICRSGKKSLLPSPLHYLF